MTSQQTRATRPWAALAVLCSTLIAVTLDTTVLNTAVPSIARSLNASTAALQWIVDAYTLTFAALLLTSGGLASRLGPRRVLTAGLAVFAVASVGAALAASPAQLIGARAVMGAGAALVMPATLTTLLRTFDDRTRPKAVALWSASSGVGVVLGPVLGGALLTRYSWGSVFWINVPLVVAALVAVRRWVPDLPGHVVGRLDIIGTVTSTAALGALVDAIIRAPERGWLSVATAAETVAGVGLLWAFVAWELRTTTPMIDVRLFRRRSFTAGSVVLGATLFALFGALFVLTQFLQIVQGRAPLVAGLAAAPFAFAMALTAGLSDVMSRRVGTHALVATGLGGMAVGLLPLAFLTPHTALLAICGAMAVTGAGMGMVMAPASNATLAGVPLESSGTVSAVNGVVRELGGVIGVAVVGSVVAAAYRSSMAASPALAGLPPAARQAAAHDVTAAAQVAVTPSGGAVLAAASNAFTTAMHSGVWWCVGVAAVGAAGAVRWLPRRVHAAAAAVVSPESDPALEPALA